MKKKNDCEPGYLMLGSRWHVSTEWFIYKYAINGMITLVQLDIYNNDTYK